MLPRRLIPLLFWLGALLGGPWSHPAVAQTQPLDSLVREPLDNQLPAPAAAPRPDSLVQEPPGLPAIIVNDTTRRAPRRLRPDVTEYAYVDSLSARLLSLGRWRALDSLGRRALAAGQDYPLLRQRLGYAAARRGRPAAAATHYAYALRDNSADPISRTGLVLAWQALLQHETAAQLAAPLPDSVRRSLHLAPRLLYRAEAEAGGQWTSSRDRLGASFLRLSLAAHLGWGIVLTQAVGHYAQQVRLDEEPPRPGRLPDPHWVDIRQVDYQTLLTVPLPLRLQLRTGYHYIHSQFGRRTYPGHLGYAALRYTRPYWQLQAGLYAGQLTDTTRLQTDVQLTVLPLGNANLYAFGRAALVHSSGRTYAHPMLGAGGRLASRLWLEGYVGWGRVPVLADQDGTYVYNLLDPLRRRLGLGLLVPLPGGHWLTRLYYGAETRTQIQLRTPYTQYTLTLAATWTW